MARTSSEQWAKRVERWKDSGLSAKDFAAETGLKATALSYWKWKLSAAERAQASGDSEASRAADQLDAQDRPSAGAASAASPKFVELPVAAVHSASAVLELWLGDARVLVPAGVDEATLTRVVRAVEAAR